MSAPAKPLQRADLAMEPARAEEFLRRGYAGRLATTGPDGWPYAVPLLYVYSDGLVWMHHARRDGHLAANLRADARACFVVDEPGTVYGYGRFECDSSVSYASVMAFGMVEPVQDDAAKALFCERLMAKYGSGMAGRPAGFFPRLDLIAVFALRVARLTGKEIPLPPPAARWPQLDRTRSPDAVPPGWSDASRPPVPPREHQ